MGSREPTPRQAEILEYLVRSVEATGCQPSLRETARHFSVNLNAIVNAFDALEKKGLVRRNGRHGVEFVGLRFQRLTLECPGHGRVKDGLPCCGRAGEYNGFGSDGPTSFTCPSGCSCHD